MRVLIGQGRDLERGLRVKDREKFDVEWFTIAGAVRELSCIPEGVVTGEIARGEIATTIVRRAARGEDGKVTMREVRMIHRSELERRLARVGVPQPAAMPKPEVA